MNARRPASSTRPLATCATCRGSYSVRLDGKVRRHTPLGGTRVCPGSGVPPLTPARVSGVSW